MPRKPLDRPKQPVWFVVWEDVTDDPRWVDGREVAECFKPATLVEQVGYKVAVTKKYVLFASQRSSDGDWGNLTKIPRALIRKMRRM
jgi:hypothetical protein